MNFSQLQERLRFELLGRIERGSLTVSLIARKAGMGQPHISNFLHNKRAFSIGALDRVLAALDLGVADLLPPPQTGSPAHPLHAIPLVSQHAAVHEDHIRPSSIQERIFLPAALLANLRAHRVSPVPARVRFVAIAITTAQAAPMEPLLHSGALLIIDRHATTLSRTTASSQHLYVLPVRGELCISFLSLDQNFLLLRPNQAALPVELLPVPPHTHAAALVTGRVSAILQSR